MSGAGEGDVEIAASPQETMRFPLLRAMADALHEESDHGRDGCPMGWLPICNCTEKAQHALSAFVVTGTVERLGEVIGWQVSTPEQVERIEEMDDETAVCCCGHKYLEHGDFGQCEADDACPCMNYEDR